MFRPLARGFRDTLDNLLPFTMASMAWWLGALLVVTAPAATLALFARCDPRRLGDHAALTLTEAIDRLRRELLPGWALAIAFGIPVAVLVQNLIAYRSTDGPTRWLLPFWVLLLLLVVAAAAVACSLRANQVAPIGSAIRQASLLVLANTWRTVPIAIVLWVITAIGGVLVVPAIMFVPALTACTINHLVYALLGIPVGDPLAPTPERRTEEAQSRGGKYSVG